MKLTSNFQTKTQTSHKLQWNTDNHASINLSWTELKGLQKNHSKNLFKYPVSERSIFKSTCWKWTCWKWNCTQKAKGILFLCLRITLQSVLFLTTSHVSLSSLTCKMSIPQSLLTETGVHTTHPQQEGTVAGQN